MLITRLDKLLLDPQTKKFSPQVLFWLSLSVIFAAFYSRLGLEQAFGSAYVIQDDARQHVFWMQRFIDPELFPKDLIADYFQSVAPPGYATLYRLVAMVGVNPILLSKLLPSVLGLIATGYCFACVIQIFPVPVAGFMATLLLNQNLWMKDDLASGTPRAFLYPLFLAFLYYVLRRQWLPVCGAIALQALFYPQVVFICASILILRLFDWENGRFALSQNRRDYWLCGAGLVTGVLVMLPYALKPNEFGPIITGAEARLLPEFTSKGRSSFFLKNFWEFWFDGQRSGILPVEWIDLPYNYFLAMFIVGSSLLLLLRTPSRFPLAKQVNSGIVLLPQIFLASVGMFFAAHLLLFKLHLPSRYTQHSMRILMAISAAIALTLLLDAIFGACRQPDQPHRKIRQGLAIATTVVLGTILLTYPNSEKKFPTVSYKIGRASALYEFLQQQPKDSLIASLTEEGGNLPSFAQRSVLAARQYAIPYHTGYYNQIRQRTIDLIDAQYSPDLKQVQSFIQKYGIDFWLLDRTAFVPGYLTEDRKDANRVWIRQHQPAAAALARLEQGTVPVLASFMGQCSVFEAEALVVLKAECITTSLNSPKT